MTRSGHKTLGIAMQEKGLLVIEARPSATETALHGAVRMDVPGAALPAGAGALAAQLRGFLHENHLHARRAVVGVPARWLVCREMTVPPVDASQLAGLLRIRTEREIGSDVGRLAADYFRAPGAPADSPILLVAMLQDHMDQVKALCQQAGLKLDAVVPTIMVLALGAPRQGCQIVLNVREDGTDMAILTDGSFRVVRDVPATDAAGLTGAIRRVLIPLGSPTGRVTLWGQTPEGLAGALGERLGMEAHAGQSAAPLPAAGGSAGTRAFAGAAALALADSNEAARPVNLVRSRLAEERTFHLGRRSVWAAIVAGAALIALIATFWDWQHNKGEVAGLQAKLKGMQPQIDAATLRVDRITQARGWYDRRPPFMDCLLALTKAFPLDGSIWASSLRVNDDMRCVVTGKTTDDNLPLKLMDKLKGSPQSFKDVKLLYVTGGTGGDRTSSFAISFTYVETE
jgi:hypothetical protein